MSGRSSRATELGLLALLALAGCTQAGAKEGGPLAAPLRIAAAADLALAFKELGAVYEKQTGQKSIFTFGSTGLLAKQIEEGAPYDLFAAANVSFADDVIAAGACHKDSRALYARGRIVVWTQKGSAPPKSVAELADKRFVKVAVANPEHAPYGRAAVQALGAAGVLGVLKPRLVYGENVQQAFQFARSGNTEAAIVALSLAVVSDGEYLLVDDKLHAPIDQALVACGKDPARVEAARGFAAFVNSTEGRAVMKRYGFLLPGERTARLP
jgi:molybdate transport system substrate-binding protein